MRIATWNVLNDTESWWKRIPGIVGVIRRDDPDIICLQEVIDAGKNTMKIQLKRAGYEISEASDTNGTDKCYVAWKSDGYDLSGEYSISGIDVKIVRLATRSGSRLFIASYHGLWGAERNHERTIEVRSIISWMEGHTGPGDLVYLAGDFNARPYDHALKVLHGEEDDDTYWTDAASAPVVRGLGHGTSLKTGMALKTAKRKSIIMPSALPDRTIDHILVRGWMHGKRGGFKALEARSFADLSDHALLMADII